MPASAIIAAEDGGALINPFVLIIFYASLVLAFLAALGGVMLFTARFFVGNSADRRD